jgi:hypothetical protein
MTIGLGALDASVRETLPSTAERIEPRARTDDDELGAVVLHALHQTGAS